VRQALEGSRNIPTVRIAVTEVSPGRTLLPDIVETARLAGISSPLEPYPSLALGSFEISPMEVAAAYCTFANGGFRMRPNALLASWAPIAAASKRETFRSSAPRTRAQSPSSIPCSRVWSTGHRRFGPRLGAQESRGEDGHDQ